jgi:hypothetical protein
MIASARRSMILLTTMSMSDDQRSQALMIVLIVYSICFEEPSVKDVPEGVSNDQRGF